MKMTRIEDQRKELIVMMMHMLFHKDFQQMIEEDWNNLNEDMNLVDLIHLNDRLIELHLDFDKLNMMKRLNCLLFHIHYYCH